MTLFKTKVTKLCTWLGSFALRDLRKLEELLTVKQLETNVNFYYLSVAVAKDEGDQESLYPVKDVIRIKIEFSPALANPLGSIWTVYCHDEVQSK